MQKKLIMVFLPIFLLFSLMSACKPKEKTPLVVFAAGSLIVPFDEIEKEFEKKYPNIDVYIETHGSIQCVRHASELDEDIDLVVSADHSLIPMLMYETIDPETQQPYADWTMKFATNKMTLAYNPDSLFADEINNENWYEILTREDVRFGLSDPRFDANGYRTLMVFNLAEDHYNDSEIFSNMVRDKFLMPISVIRGRDFDKIKVPEILQPNQGSGIHLRGSSVMLIAILESGDIDYAFEYESVAIQHGFEMVELPPELQLNDLEYLDVYDNVQVKLDFQRFKSVEPVFDGGRIEYGLTIPTTALHAQEAELFIEFLMGEEGQLIMSKHSHPMIVPGVVDNPENVPVILQKLSIAE